MKSLSGSQKKPSNMPKPHFKAALKDGTLDLAVYGDIGANWWDDNGVTASTVKKEMDAVSFDRIVVRINSPGGDAFEGVAICNLLRSAGKPVDVFIDGIAASAASIIAMAGDTRTMGKGAMMMIHNAWGFCQGNAADMTKMASTLQGASDAIAETYTDSTGKTLAEIKKMMDDETWMGADECMANGFATAVTANNAKAMAMVGRFKAIAVFRHVPESLKANQGVACECECQECLDGNCDECSHIDCDCPGCENCGMMAANSAAAKIKADAAKEPPPVPEPAPTPVDHTAARNRELRLMRMRLI